MLCGLGDGAEPPLVDFEEASGSMMNLDSASSLAVMNTYSVYLDSILNIVPSGANINPDPDEVYGAIPEESHGTFIETIRVSDEDEEKIREFASASRTSSRSLLLTKFMNAESACNKAAKIGTVNSRWNTFLLFGNILAFTCKF